jgi:hypothetical protein
MNVRTPILLVASLSLAACASADRPDPNGRGSVSVALASVPGDVSCIRLTLVGAGATVQRSFDVAHGASSVLNVDDLPPGSMTFSADAFPTACSAVTPTTIGSWVSDKQTVNLVGGVPTFLTLTMTRNGQACVSVDFPPDAFSPAAGTPAATGPIATITSGPSGTVSSTSATFAVTASTTDAILQCALDAGSFATCTSPVTYSALANGAHTFRVRAVSPTCVFGPIATRTFTLDTAPPVVTITAGPSGTITTTSTSLAFSVTEAATTTCALDTGAYAACSSPVTYTGLSNGPHNVSIRAIDAAGNVGTATRAFTVDTSDFTSVAIPLGSLTLAAGQELTRCAVIPVNNTVARLVRNARIQTTAGMAEVAVYRSAGPASALADCTMFNGLSSGAHLLMIGDRPDTNLAFPTTAAGAPVGFSLPAASFLKVELHGMNATAAAITASATLTLDSIIPPSNAVAADLALSTVTTISVPAAASATVSAYQAGISAASTFALAMHSHQSLTSGRADLALGASDPAPVSKYVDTTPSNPPLASFSPAIAMTGSNGFKYQCTFSNTKSAPIAFGMSMADEQCMLLQWYYPAAGFQRCIDGGCTMIP